MKKRFFIYFVVVLFLMFPFLLGTANSSSLDVATVEQIRLPRPQIYKLGLNTGIPDLLVRATSLTVSGEYATGLYVTVANVGSSSYYIVLVEVDVYNYSMDKIASGFGFYLNLFNPIDPGEYVNISVSLIPQVPINQTMYINASVISAI